MLEPAQVLLAEASKRQNLLRGDDGLITDHCKLNLYFHLQNIHGFRGRPDRFRGTPSGRVSIMKVIKVMKMLLRLEAYGFDLFSAKRARYTRE
jgi:hypothetical protein